MARPPRGHHPAVRLAAAHLWPTSAKRDEQIERATGLGAVVLEDRRRADGTGWVVFADPDGNEFCIGRSEAERATD